MAFGDLDFFKRMCRAEIVYMDGTFKCVPSVFYQLYTMHCKLGGTNGQMFPIIYALLPSKTQATYRRLFQKLKEKAIEHGLIFNPKLFQIDYEIAVINAINLEFPPEHPNEIRVRGCLFHYTQAIWRKVNRFRNPNKLRSNRFFRSNFLS